MKNSALLFLAVTTLLLLVLIVFWALDFPFHWLFYLTVLGQGLLVYTVYLVLTDKYTTDKTFDDFYEDYPIGREDTYS